MALFCKKCADKFGMIPDSLPLLCEGCGKKFQKRESIMRIVFNKFNSDKR